MLPPDPRRRAKMNSAKPKRPVLSIPLGQLPPGFIAVRCADCDHRDAPDVVAVRDRAGPDTAVSDLVRRFRCRKCRGPATSID